LLIGRTFHEGAGQMFDDLERSIEKAKQEMMA
jgi:hypothetical protein